MSLIINQLNDFLIKFIRNPDKAYQLNHRKLLIILVIEQMNYSIVIYPVSRHQAAVVKLIFKGLGPDSMKNAKELAERGGTILENLNKEAATHLASQLSSKLAVLKVIIGITGHGLQDSKELVDELGVVAENITKVAAEKMKKKLEAKGAKVEIRQISISDPSPVEKSEQRKNSDSLNDLKIIFDGNKTTVVIETHSGHKLQISKKNNSLLLEDHNGNKIRLSQDGVLVL